MDSIGGNLDAFTGKETICFNVKSLADHVPIALDVLADLVLNPVFASPEIERERGVILEEIKIDEDNPDVLVARALHAEFLEGPSARQTDPGHHQNRWPPRSAETHRLPYRQLPRRKHGLLRCRQS